MTSSKNSKELYSIFGKLTGKQSSLILPSDTPAESLPDKFNSFFIDKISKIRCALDSFDNIQTIKHTDFSGNTLTLFRPVSTDYVLKTYNKCKKKLL